MFYKQGRLSINCDEVRHSALESGRVDTTVTQEGRRGTEPDSQNVSVGHIKVWGDGCRVARCGVSTSV
jgi:hypothetical protein